MLVGRGNEHQPAAIVPHNNFFVYAERARLMPVVNANWLNIVLVPETNDTYRVDGFD